MKFGLAEMRYHFADGALPKLHEPGDKHDVAQAQKAAE
jgi:hypothetical protein